MNDETNTNPQNDGGGIFTPLSFVDPASGGNTKTQTPQATSTEDKTNPEDIIVIGRPENSIKIEPEEPKGPVGKETQDLTSMGVTFVGDESPKQEKNIFSQDSSFKEKEMEALGMKEPGGNTPQNTVRVDTKDLEADFSKTFNTPVSSSSHEDTGNPIALEEAKLKRLHKELKDKASAKKIVVKERLEKLKQEKESLGKELEDIKELEGIAAKIEEKLKSLETIDTEIDTLEAKAQEELK